ISSSATILRPLMLPSFLHLPGRSEVFYANVLENSQMVGVLRLQGADEEFELGQAAKARKAGVFQEVWPAGKSGAHAAFQPFKGGLAASRQSQRACDLMVSVVRMAE